MRLIQVVEKYNIRFQNFRDRYNDDFHISEKDHANHKLHAMTKLHKSYLENAIKMVKEFSSKGVFSLDDTIVCSTENYQITKESVESFNEKFKTELSVPMVANILCRIMTVISPDYNKKHLAKVISDNFQTKRSDNLSEKQVYKSMYDDDPRIDELIRKVGFKLLKGGK